RLINGTTYSGFIHRGDLDPWSFFAARNEALTIRVSEVLVGQVDPGFVPWVRLFGPDGKELAANQSTTAVQLNLKAPLTGTYLVLVADSTINREGSATGNYVISTENTTVGQTRYGLADRGGISQVSPGAPTPNVAQGYVRIDPDGGSANPSGLAIFGFRQNNI